MYRTYTVADTVLDAPMIEFLPKLAALLLHNMSINIPQTDSSARMTATRASWDADLLELAVYDESEREMVFVGWARLR